MKRGGVAQPVLSHGGGELIPGKALNREELINDLVKGGRAMQNMGTLEAEPEASIFLKTLLLPCLVNLVVSHSLSQVLDCGNSFCHKTHH